MKTTHVTALKISQAKAAGHSSQKVFKKNNLEVQYYLEGLAQKFKALTHTCQPNVNHALGSHMENGENKIMWYKHNPCPRWAQGG